MLLTLLTLSSFGQSLYLFDVDTTNYPKMKAKFLSVEQNGEKITPNINDLQFKENNLTPKIESLNCKSQKEKSISVGIIVNTSSNIEFVKFAIISLVESLRLPEDEISITLMDKRSLIIQDFTNDKELLKSKANSLTQASGFDLNSALNDNYTGMIPLIENKKTDKKIIVLLNDVLYSNSKLNESKLIDEANNKNISIYSITINTNDNVGIFNNITRNTGGVSYNYEMQQNIKSILQEIYYKNKYLFCEFEWISDFPCDEFLSNIQLKHLNNSSKSTYTISSEKSYKARIQPSIIEYVNFDYLGKYDTSITIYSFNKDFVIDSIIGDEVTSVFEFENITYPYIIKKGDSLKLNIKFKPSDNTSYYNNFELVNKDCSVNFSLNCWITGRKIYKPNLKLLSPNGEEVIVSGADTLITWTGVNRYQPVSLDFSIDSGKTWTNITQNAINFEYIWKNVPLINNNSCLVKVSQIKTQQTKDSVYLLKGHNIIPSDLQWHPNGDILSSNSCDESFLSIMNLWDAKQGELIFSNKSFEEAGTVTWSPNGEKLIKRNINNISSIWDTKKWKKLLEIRDPNWLYRFNWSPDSKQIAIVNEDFVSGDSLFVTILDAETGLVIKNLENIYDVPENVYWSKNGKYIVSNNNFDGSIIWDAKTFKRVKTLDVKNQQFSWSSDSKLIAFTDSNYFTKILDADNFNTIKILKGRFQSWSPDNSYIVTRNSDSTLEIWDYNSGLLKREVIGQNGTWNFNGTMFATNYKDSMSIIWEGYNFTKIYQVIERHNIARWSPKGLQLATRGTTATDSIIYLWNIPDILPLQSDTSDNMFSIQTPKMKVNIPQIDLNKVLIGKEVDTTITRVLCNDSKVPLHITGMKLTSGDIQDFNISDNLKEIVLQSGDCSNLQIVFHPNKSGKLTASLTINTTIGDFKDVIIFQGEGVDSTVQLNSEVLDFGIVNIDNTSGVNAKAIIRNIGAKPLQISSISKLAPNVEFFSILNNPAPIWLQPSDSTTLDIQFSPNYPGKITSRLSIDYNDIGSPAQVVLFGNGEKVETEPVFKPLIEIKSIQPNPASDYIEVYYEFNSLDKADLRITNILGEVVYSQTLAKASNGYLKIDARNFGTGQYFATFTSENIMQNYIIGVVR